MKITLNLLHNFRRELRRLNGNFVTASNALSYSNEPCPRDFCEKGCVCQGFNYSHSNRFEIDAAKVSFNEYKSIFFCNLIKIIQIFFF